MMLPDRIDSLDLSTMVEQVALTGQLVESSMDLYRAHIERYKAFCETYGMNMLDPKTFEQYRNALIAMPKEDGAGQRTAAYINNNLIAIRQMVKWAGEHDYLQPEIAAKFLMVKLVSERALRNRMKPYTRVRLSEKEIHTLLASIDQSTLYGARNVALVATLASSGLRVSELCNLTVEQLYAQDGSWFFAVQGKKDIHARAVPVAPVAVERIQAWLTRREQETGITVPYVFTAFSSARQEPLAHPLSTEAVRQLLRKLVHAAGLVEQRPVLAHITPHWLRRYVGTEATSRYGIAVGAQVLGHKNINTTQQHYNLATLPGGLTDDLVRL